MIGVMVNLFLTLILSIFRPLTFISTFLLKILDIHIWVIIHQRRILTGSSINSNISKGMNSRISFSFIILSDLWTESKCEVVFLFLIHYFWALFRWTLWLTRFQVDFGYLLLFSKIWWTRIFGGDVDVFWWTLLDFLVQKLVQLGGLGICFWHFLKTIIENYIIFIFKFLNEDLKNQYIY